MIWDCVPVTMTLLIVSYETTDHLQMRNHTRPVEFYGEKNGAQEVCLCGWEGQDCGIVSKSSYNVL